MSYGLTFGPGDTLDDLELGALQFRRFLDVDDEETVELTAFGASKKVHVAYARTWTDQVRLLREACERTDVTGVYTVFNQLHEGLYARIGDRRWVPFAPRATDKDIVAVRAAYLDFDAIRPRDISSTDDEKRAAHEALEACERYLVSAFGDDAPLGRGDSGNGYSLFVRLVPVVPSPAVARRISRFLEAMAKRFSNARAKVDTSVSNPARLCPAFGVPKRKGVNYPNRPHRGTFFSCRPWVRCVPVEAL